MTARTVAAATGILMNLLLWRVTPAAMAQDLTSEQQVKQTAIVHHLTLRDGELSGVVENRSHRLLRDVRLLVHYAWLWRNERHPGDDSPGHSEYYTVPAEVPPQGTAAFSHQPEPPLPHRSDGHFVPSAEVVSFTEVGE